MDELPAWLTQLLETHGLARRDDPNRFGALSSIFGRGYDQTSDLRFLEYTISYLREGVERTNVGDPRHASYLNDLGTRLGDRYDRSSNTDDLKEALEKLQMAVDHTPAQSTEQAMYLNNLGNRLSSRYKKSGNLDDLESAIVNSRAAVASNEPGTPRRAMYLNSLGNRFAERYDELGDFADIVQACDASSKAVQLLPLDHPDRAMYLNNLGNHLVRKHKTTLDLTDLNQALEHIQEAVLKTPNSPNQAMFLNNLSTGLFARGKQTGTMDDLQQALTNLRGVINATPASHINHAMYTYNFADCALYMYNHTGNDGYIQRALLDWEKLANVPNKDHRDMARLLEKIGEILATISLRTQYSMDTENALAKLEEAIAIVQNPCDRARCLSRVGMSHRQKFQRTKDLRDLERALIGSQEAVKMLPQNHPDRITYLVEFADCLRTRYMQLGSLDDLERAIMLSQEAAHDLHAEHSSRSTCLYVLETMLSQKFERTGNLAYLQQALNIGEKLVDEVAKDHPNRAAFLNGLAIDLSRRFERTGDVTNLDQALARLQEAIETYPNESYGREIILASLGARLLRRYERQGELEDLEQAISSLEEAITLVRQEDSDKPNYLMNLANMLVVRYERNDHRHDLERSLSLLQQALTILPPDHPARPVALHSLGHRFNYRYRQTRSIGDLDQGQSYLEEAVDLTPRDHPNLANFLHTLANVILLKSRRTGTSDSEQESVRLLIDAVDCSSSPSLIRILCARQAIAALGRQWRWKEASDLAQTALDLLPTLCSRFLELDDQQYALEQTASFASEACSLSIKLGNVEQALERLEFGRGLMLRYIMDSRSDLSALSRTRPELAERYRHLRMRTFRPDPSQEDSLPLRISQEEKFETQRLLEDCESQIRQVEGFELFLLPTPACELQKHAVGGSIVYVNITDICADAIIVTKAHIRALSLPDMLSTKPEYLGRALELHRNAERRKTIRDVESDIQSRNSTDFLSWLWSTCVKPVLREIARDNPSDMPHGMPRIWWIGAGAANSFPFHAAGELDAKSPARIESCLRQSISSYALSIKSLAQARADAIEYTQRVTEGALVTVVTMPTTPGQSDLRGVETEYKKIQEAMARAGMVARLDSPTASQVLERMSHTNVIHFACHGTSDRRNPLQSHLLLHKIDRSGAAVDKLTVSAILDAKKARTTWLAYLSACSTAEVKAKSLMDESIHLTSAFQMAGFAHVIGSLWGADDEVSAEIARLFYTNLRKYSLDTHAMDNVARALQSAIQTISEEHRGRPGIWAPFIHLGP
jgi:tetratricopeptide (TPR) repeat protein